MANNWIELNGKKEPPFDTKMIIALKGTNAWSEVMLRKIEIVASGKEYTFAKLGDSDLEYTTASHYMIPEPPKNNQ